MMGKSIGIDLGTTNSVVAYYEGGQPLVLRTRDETLTPSVVSYSKSHPKKTEGQIGKILVGRSAVNNALVAPENTIFSIKRLMGRTIDEEKVQEARKHFGYTFVDTGDPEDRTIKVKLHDKVYTPVEISAMILAQLKEDAEKALGEEVTHAVITVPAYFEERQRNATIEAGRQAGLIVKRIIDEPTAAAIAFGIDKPDEKHRVLVYDLGGGTFDVSLVQMVAQKFAGLTIEGDMWLGGDNFDYEIVKAIEAWIRAECNFDPSSEKRFRTFAKQKAEKAKIALSRQEEFHLICPAIAHSSDGKVADLDMFITREEFNKAIHPYVDLSMDLVRKSLKSQNMEKDDITTVLMVGGVTATPLVYEAVTRLFGKEKVRRHVDPMYCVAIGASILAARLDTVDCPTCHTENAEDAKICMTCGKEIAITRVTLIEKTAKSLGIGVIKDGKPDVYAVMIPKGTRYPLPKAMERTFFTAAKNTIKLSVYEGEETIASLNERQGDVEYTLPQDVPIGTPVTVSFDYDKSRLLKVTIWVQGYPHLKKDVVVDRSGQLGSAIKSKPERDWREDVQKTLNMVRQFLADYRDFIDPGQVSKLEADLQKAEELERNENEMEAQRIMKALDSVLFSASGTASLLFLAELINRRVEQPKMQHQIRTLVKELRSAAKQNDGEQLTKASNTLRVALRVTTALIERTGATPIEDQAYYGMLKQ
jgi:molecular chaperone DnaK